MIDPIYHLAKPGDWARTTDAYSPPSIDEEGFVHCSTVDQLRVVARERYLNHNGLILLTIDPDELDHEALIYEDSYGQGEEFPHVYGPLPTSAVVSTGPYLTHLEEGMWSDPRFEADWTERVLHPEFAGVGMSGNSYTKRETIDNSRPTQFEAHLPHEDYRLELVDEDVALVRYISHLTIDSVERRAQRTSIWVNTNEGWRLRFHQGTPLA